MSNTASLKDRYQKKKSLSVTNEKLMEEIETFTDRQRLDELEIFTNRRKLNEEIDRKLLTTIVSAVKNLQAIDFGKMDILDRARDAAVLDITKVATGDDKKGFMNRVASLFRDNKSPVFDALAFGSAIAGFFPLLSQYVEALASKGGQVADETKTIEDIAQTDELKTAISKIISRGLRPTGALAKMGAGWAKKYLQGSLDDLSTQIMQSTLAEIKQVTNSVKQATTNVSRVAQIAAQAAQQSQQNPTTALPTTAADAFKKIETQLGTLGPAEQQTVGSVLKALEQAGLLK